MPSLPRLLFALALMAIFAAPSFAQDVKEPRSVVPADRNDKAWWANRHAHKKRLAEKNAEQIELVFIGDSITQGFEGKGKGVWETYYAPRGALNLGYSGDRTEHVIWRLENGEVDAISPKLAVLMIGTNNTGHRREAPEHIAAGVERIVDLLQQKLPETPLLLLAIFPRGETADHKMRRINDAANELIKPLGERENVHYLDISHVFLDEDGSIPKAIMPDHLHPVEAGYQLWATAMEPTIGRLMGESAAADAPKAAATQPAE